MSPMKTTLRVLAVTLALGSVGLWLATGAHCGWTRTSVPVKTLDDITGIEAIEYQTRFVPGVDFLGGAWLAAAALAGLSVLFRNQTKPTTDPQHIP